MKTLDIINLIGLRIIGPAFDHTKVADVMIDDGGMDMDPLTKNDLIKLMEGSFEGSWQAVHFSFCELLASYSHIKLSNYQIIAWCFTLLIIGEINRRHLSGWERQLLLITNAFDQITKSLSYEEFSVLLKDALNPEADYYEQK